MRTIKKKPFLLFIGFVLFVFFINPFTYFKTNSNIKIHGSTKTNIWDTKVIDKTSDYGFYINQKKVKIGAIAKIKSINSWALNLGIYSKFVEKFSFERVIGNEIVNIEVDAENSSWGFGNVIARKNYFYKTIRKAIEDDLNKQFNN